MNYDSLIKKLFTVNLFGGIKLGLSNMKHLSALLNYPEKQFPSIHVAGTNGKGSVATKIAAAYTYAGAKVGLYTSPHISCFRERIRMNGEMITEEDIVKHLSTIFQRCEQEKIPATFFEITTLLAFSYFAEQKVDIAILETGLGGRLDATNIVVPILSIITSISFDHKEILGNTIEAIASEKAGIIKPFIPIVVGPRVPHLLFKERAQNLKAPYYQVEGSFSNFLEENTAIAHKALNLLGVPPLAITKGLQTLPVCRMEYDSEHSFILDVAHNPDGLEKLFIAVKERFPQHTLKVICGLSKNKDIQACIAQLKKFAPALYLVEATNGRGLPVKEFEEQLKMEGYEGEINLHSSIEETVQTLLKARKEEELIVACGSFFIMRAIRECLNIEEPRDPIDLNECYRLKPHR